MDFNCEKHGPLPLVGIVCPECHEALRRERDRLMRLLEGLTPDGSEFHDSPDRCAEWARARTKKLHRIAVKLAKRWHQAAAQRDALAELVRQACEWFDLYGGFPEPDMQDDYLELYPRMRAALADLEGGQGGQEGGVLREGGGQDRDAGRGAGG